MLKNLILLLLLFPNLLFAQTSISGNIINKDSRKPVPDASVFLSNASVGGKTNDDGSFTLTSVRNGQYDMVVTCVGFEAFHTTLLVNGTAIHLSTIELIPRATELKEVTIKYDPNRERYVRIFTDEFLGRSENSAQCKILNPEILDLDFDKSTGKLTASTTDFIIIENKALGYRIKYLLASFIKDQRINYLFYTGSSVFEELPGKASQQKRWIKKRAQAYLGSDMNFYRACIANQVEEDGFVVNRLIREPTGKPTDSLIRAKINYFRSQLQTPAFQDSITSWSAKSRMPKYTQTLINKPLSTTDYIKRTERKGIFAIGYKDCLMVTYKKDLSTIITYNLPYAFFDNNGVVLNPESNTFEGYWATQRMADLLPVDYQLPEK